jgi:hypothetical protein
VDWKDEAADIENEQRRIFDIRKETELVGVMREFFARRQMSSAKHSILVGYAVRHAINQNWVPTGKEEYAAYCKETFGFSRSHIDSCRKLSAEYDKNPGRFLTAQTFLHVHHDVFVEHGGNVPETSSTASVGKAAKALEKYEELEPVRGRKDALLAAAVEEARTKNE